MSRIYLDYASLTPIDPRVLREMRRFSSADFANPSSIYKEGVMAKKALEGGRKSVSSFLGAHSDEIFFTSGGTEANNIAIIGAQKAFESKNEGGKGHLVISAIEHSSIMETAAQLEKQGVEVTRLFVGQKGVINLDDLKRAIKPNTFLVSVMAVNNEIGTIQPIKEIAKVVRHARAQIAESILFHTDASQAALYMDLNVQKSGVDLLTLDSSKMYGPRGMGALFIKRGVELQPMIFGGGQEKGIRSGTENIGAIMGFAKALEIAKKESVKATKTISGLKRQFSKGLKSVNKEISVNPKGVKTDAEVAPHILNVNIPGIDNEFFVLQLDAKGIACSTKSSCLRDGDESYVLRAIGADSKTSVRFSFGRWTKVGDIKKSLGIVRQLLG